MWKTIGKCIHTHKFYIENFSPAVYNKVDQEIYWKPGSWNFLFIFLSNGLLKHTRNMFIIRTDR